MLIHVPDDNSHLFTPAQQRMEAVYAEPSLAGRQSPADFLGPGGWGFLEVEIEDQLRSSPVLHSTLLQQHKTARVRLIFSERQMGRTVLLIKLADAASAWREGDVRFVPVYLKIMENQFLADRFPGFTELVHGLLAPDVFSPLPAGYQYQVLIDIQPHDESASKTKVLNKLSELLRNCPGKSIDPAIAQVIVAAAASRPGEWELRDHVASYRLKGLSSQAVSATIDTRPGLHRSELHDRISKDNDSIVAIFRCPPLMRALCTQAQSGAISCRRVLYTWAHEWPGTRPSPKNLARLNAPATSLYLLSSSWFRWAADQYFAATVFFSAALRLAMRK